MDEEWQDSDVEDAEVEEDSKLPTQFKPSCTLIAIDTDESMFIENEDWKKSPFVSSLESCYEIANSLITPYSGKLKGPIGIVFAHNDCTKATFVEMQDTVLDMIHVIKDLTKQSNNELKSKYLQQSSFDLADFFEFCKNKLVKFGEEVYKRSVLYITNNDDPAKGDVRKNHVLIKQVEKFLNTQIDLHVFTFKENFNTKLSYSELLPVCNSPEVKNINFENLSNNILNFVKVKYYKYKFKFYPFPDDTKRYIDMVEHKFIKNTVAPKRMYVTKDTQKEVKKTVTVSDNQKAHHTLRYSNINNLTIKNKDEFLETNVPVGYTLLYVAEETVKTAWIIEPPYLIEAKESDSVMHNFWQFCKDKSKVLVCYRKRRIRANIRYVELIPKFINNARMFLVKTVPFATEISYNVQNSDNVKFNVEEEEAVENLINAFTFDFKPSNFSDPVMSKTTAYIKSQLLKTSVEKIESDTLTDEEVDKVLSEQIQELINLGVAQPIPSTINKRAKSTKGGISKKAKVN